MTDDEAAVAGERTVAPPRESGGLAGTNPGFVAAALAAVVAFAATAPASWLATAAAGGGALALVTG
uniref:hypothetical protein n=1 Tax=Halorubellus salinus TaxID=755309 RepID=UPI001D05E84C